MGIRPSELVAALAARTPAAPTSQPTKDADGPASVVCTADTVVSGDQLLAAISGQSVAGIQCQAPQAASGVTLRPHAVALRGGAARADDASTKGADKREAVAAVSARGPELQVVLQQAEYATLTDNVNRASGVLQKVHDDALQARMRALAASRDAEELGSRLSDGPNSKAAQVAVRAAEARAEKAEKEAQAAEALERRLVGLVPAGVVAELVDSGPRRLRDVAKLHADVSMLASKADPTASTAQTVYVAPSWHKARTLEALSQRLGQPAAGSRVDADARRVISDAVAVHQLLRAARVAETAWQGRMDVDAAVAAVATHDGAADVADVDPDHLWQTARARMFNELSWYEALFEPNPTESADQLAAKEVAVGVVSSYLSYAQVLAREQHLAAEVRQAVGRAMARAEEQSHDVRSRVEGVYGRVRHAVSAELSKLKTQDHVVLQLANR